MAGGPGGTHELEIDHPLLGLRYIALEALYSSVPHSKLHCQLLTTGVATVDSAVETSSLFELQDGCHRLGLTLPNATSGPLRLRDE